MSEEWDFRAGGVLFPNMRPKTSSGQPDFRGEVVIDEALLMELMRLAKAKQPLKLALAGWKKTSKKGDSFLSLKPEVSRERPSAPERSTSQPPPPAPLADDPFSDDPPF